METAGRMLGCGAGVLETACSASYSEPVRSNLRRAEIAAGASRRLAARPVRQEVVCTDPSHPHDLQDRGQAACHDGGEHGPQEELLGPRLETRWSETARLVSRR